MQISGGGNHIHHHGLLSGLGAGAVGVLAALGLVLVAWHAVGQAVGQAVTVIVWALVAAVIAAVAYGVLFLVLRSLHHVRHPETLARQAVRAEIIPAEPVPAIVGAPVAALPVPAAAAIEAPRREIHYHFNTAEAVWAARRVIGTAGTPEAEEIPR